MTLVVNKLDDVISFIERQNMKERVIKSHSNPNRKSIETTLAVSKRRNIPPHRVVHRTNWKKILCLSSVPTDWKFNMDTKRNLKHRDGFTVDIFSATECSRLIELTETCGYVDCGFLADYRSNTRVMTRDPMFAERLYHRIKECFPLQYVLNGVVWELCGLDDRLRWCRYTKGQHFGVHCDDKCDLSADCKSFYTVNVYLNDGHKDFKGGRTLFFRGKYEMHPNEAVIATTGCALVFNHFPDRILHSGERVTEGVKYLMHADVLYRKVGVTERKECGPCR